MQGRKPAAAAAAAGGRIEPRKPRRLAERTSTVRWAATKPARSALRVSPRLKSLRRWRRALAWRLPIQPPRTRRDTKGRFAPANPHAPRDCPAAQRPFVSFVLLVVNTNARGRAGVSMGGGEGHISPQHIVSHP